MAETKQEIISEIDSHIEDSGGGYSAWYVGVSKDARDRLFNQHGVKEKGDSWIYRAASSSKIAREVEAHLVDKLGTDGGSGGGDETATMVYAYKKARHTDP